MTLGFNFLKRNHPKKQTVYAVTTGVFVGELLVYMEDSEDNHKFLSLPNMINRDIPIDKFKLGLQNKIVDIVDTIPRSIYKVCLAQYKKNKAGK
tara:strand:- start:268 stop:549 length:282 start_codon:yes stop_codon:yes gene_type:complete